MIDWRDLRDIDRRAKRRTISTPARQTLRLTRPFVEMKALQFLKSKGTCPRHFRRNSIVAWIIHCRTKEERASLTHNKLSKSPSIWS
jgi:hypothetical protein